MATAVDIAKLEELCQCSICLCRYSEPLQLRCQHSFCKDCIESLAKLKFVEGKIDFVQKVAITCPNCREETVIEEGKGLSNLQGNLYLKQLIGLIDTSTPEPESQGGGKECCQCNLLQCKEIFNCFTCNSLFCIKCFKQQHSNLPVGLGLPTAASATFNPELQDTHNAMKLTRDRDGEYFYHCIHHNLIVKYFCQSCQKPICIDCGLTDHKFHEIQILNNVAAAVQRSIRCKLPAELEELTVMKERYKTHLKEIDDVGNKIVSGVSSKKRLLLAKISHVLDKAEQEILQTFLLSKKNFVHETEIQLSKLDKAVSLASATRQNASSTPSSTSSVEIAVKGSEALRHLDDLKDQNTPSKRNSFLAETFIFQRFIQENIPSELQWKLCVLLFDAMGCLANEETESMKRMFSPSFLHLLSPVDQELKDVFGEMTNLSLDTARNFSEVPGTKRKETSDGKSHVLSLPIRVI